MRNTGTEIGNATYAMNRDAYYGIGSTENNFQVILD